jgi:uncharacterized protein
MGVAMSAGCASSELGGLSLSEAFPDSKVAALVTAASDHDFAEADRLLKAGVGVNSLGAQGITPLAWLMADKNKPGVEYLLKAGADPNIKSLNHGRSALSLAVEISSPEMLDLLLKHRGDPNLRGPNEEPLLHIAARRQREEQINVLLQHGADINIYGTITKGTAATTAVDMGRYDLAVYLVERGLNYDIQGLAMAAEIIQVPRGSEQDRWKQKLIELLKARGAKFPAYTPRKKFN